MSFPRFINPLVIEDDPAVKDRYDAMFHELRKTYPVAAPRFAFCHREAADHLSSRWPFHLVVLDLRLPEERGQPEPESLDYGQSILGDCVRRDDYPVPALLVVSGNLQRAASQDALRSSVRDGFHHGRVLVKSESNIEAEIVGAVEAVLRYQEVGLHVADGGGRVFPTVSPREEDLIRRCVCAQEHATGVDLTWWSATSTPSAGWTKTLVGHFFLREGRAQSVSHFFKLATADGADSVCHAARAASLTHQHVKVPTSIIGHSRSLLVTQSAGRTRSLPRPLAEVLALPPALVGPSLRGMASAVADQVGAFGVSTPDQHPAGRLLWPHHSRARIAGQWGGRGGGAVLAAVGPVGADPLTVFDRLAASRVPVPYVRQDARHGDLNVSNVAVEETADGRFAAWVFDAADAGAGASVRDLATLEVTALLHQPPCDADPLVEQCRALFDCVLADGTDYGVLPPADRGANTHQFILGLRSEALRRASPVVYAISLFDEALVQLGGLEFGSSYNKIRHPPDSAHLAALTAGLVVRTASHLMTDSVAASSD